MHMTLPVCGFIPVSAARLEAAHMDDGRKIKDLLAELTHLKKNLGEVEKERLALLNSQNTASEEHKTSVNSLISQIDHLKHEKQQLHLQYAREIEAAQSRLSAREQELGSHQLRLLKEAQLKHSQELEAVQVRTCIYVHMFLGLPEDILPLPMKEVILYRTTVYIRTYVGCVLNVFLNPDVYICVCTHGNVVTCCVCTHGNVVTCCVCTHGNVVTCCVCTHGNCVG